MAVKEKPKKKPKSLFELILPEEVPGADKARYGIFGNNGGGKSSLAASAAKAGLRVLVASAGVENIKPYKGYGTRIRVHKMRTWEDHYPLIKFLELDLNRPEVVSGEKRPRFDVVVFDTWTRMQGLASRKISGWKPPTDLAGLQRALLIAPKTPRGYQDWQQIGELSNQWISYYQDLPIHLVFLFQEQVRTPTSGGEDNIIQTGPTKVGPMLTPLAIEGVRENLELLGRLYDPSAEVEDDALEENPFGVPKRAIDPEVKPERRLLIGQHSLYLTKGPTHVLGNVVMNPTWRKLAPAIGAAPLEIDDEESEIEATLEEES